MKIKIFFSISILLSLNIIAQKKTILKLLEETNSKIDSVRMKANCVLAGEYLTINIDSAEIFANKSLSLAKNLLSKRYESESYAVLGAAKKTTGKFEESIQYQLKALAIKETMPENASAMSITLNDLGILYKQMHRYNEALGYYKRSLSFSTQLKKYNRMALTTSNIGTIFSEQNNYDSAKYYFEKALILGKKANDSNAIVTALSNIGELYGKTKKYSLSLNYYTQCLLIDKALEDKYGVTSDFLSIASILLKTKKFKEAKPYLDSANKLAVEGGFMEERLGTLNAYATYYTAINDMDNADTYSGKYNQLRDSTLNQKTLNNISELNTKYETSKKEAEILKQRFQLSKRNYLLAGVFGLLILGGLLVFSYYKRNKLRQDKMLQQEILKQQTLSTKAIIDAEEKERKRIAGDLHDGIGQLFSAVKMNLEILVEKYIPKQTDAMQLSEKTLAMVDESCAEVRSIAHQMMPNALIKAGLVSALRDFVNQIPTEKLKISIETNGLENRMESNIETVLYRVIQESVNNVIKHANATELHITLLRDASEVTVAIEDNGKGFDTKQKDKFEGIGLKNMITRIEYLKGNVEISSSSNKGTSVSIYVPLT